MDGTLPKKLTSNMTKKLLPPFAAGAVITAVIAAVMSYIEVNSYGWFALAGFVIAYVAVVASDYQDEA